jgi:precorrin-2/cobalt-factor-2 C20-methyltransferase
MESKGLGTFYGVGVGPGDPELMTLKAVRVLEQCPVLAVPQTASGDMTAYHIACQAARLEDKLLLPLRFTMSRDRDRQSQAHQSAAQAVRAHLLEGRDVAMTVLGDVSIFSTYCYLMDILKTEGFSCVMVPGVPSFCAVAARLGRSLTTMNRPLHIIPGGGGEAALSALDLPGSKILMKSGKNMPAVLDQLEARELLSQAGMVQNCGLPNERVFESLEEKPQVEGYFTTIIIP